MSSDQPTLRASALNKAAQCPYSAKLLAELREHQTSTQYTTAGTTAHKAIEDSLNTGIWPDVPALRGLFSHLSRHHPGALVMAKATGDTPKRRHREVEGEYEANLGAFRLTGHPDLVVQVQSCTEVYDWKTGWGGLLPPIQHDLQMGAYAVLVAEAGAPLPIIVYRILVDRLLEERIEIKTAEQLKLIRDRILQVGSLAVLPEPMALVSPKHCWTCLGRRHCDPLVESDVLPVAAWRGEEVTDSEQAMRLLRARAAVKAWGEGILAEVQKAVRSGMRVYDPSQGRYYYHNGKRWGWYPASPREEPYAA